MPVTTDHFEAAFLGAAAILILGCGDYTQPAAPTTGALAIKVSTESESSDVDPDGYTLSIDDGPGLAVGVNAMVTIGTLPTGRHRARLAGLAPNCIVNGDNPRWVYVGSDKAPALPVSFSVSCLGQSDSGAGEWDY